MSTRLLAVPNQCNSYEDWLQAWSLDLDRLSPSELEYEKARAVEIADIDPDKWVWREREHITARQWAEERVRLCDERLARLRQPRQVLARPARERISTW